MRDKLNITIRIAELPPVGLTVRPDEEPVVRTAEYRVNQLWRSWRAKFPDKSSHQVLGMVAFQFAKLFCTLNARSDEAYSMLESFEESLDKILLQMDDSSVSEK